MKSLFTRVLNTILNILFPARSRMSDISHQLNPNHIGNTYFTALYANPIIKKSIWQIKYRADQILINHLALYIYEELLELVTELYTWHGQIGPFTIIPLPSSEERQQERGWNQTTLLCEAIKKIADQTIFTFDLISLKKIRHTVPQTKLKRHERLKNLIDCFDVDPTTIKNKTIILFDDVTTTGSTIREARKTLVDAGAGLVVALTIAH